MKFYRVSFWETVTFLCEMQCTVVLNSASILYIVFFPSNNGHDTLKLLFLLQNIFLKLVIRKNSVKCVNN